MRLRTRVHLDGQKGKPTADEALRVVGNLVTPNGKLAPPDLVKTVGIGTRVRMVFSDAAFGLGVGRCGMSYQSLKSRAPLRRKRSACGDWLKRYRNRSSA